jgi:hypothetical protein
VGAILNGMAMLIGLLTAIRELTQLFEVPGFGPEKKDAVLKSLGAMYDAVAGTYKLPLVKEVFLQIASGIIDLAVNLYNLAGIFKHKEEPAK